MSTVIDCPKCGHQVDTTPVADRVSIRGMYDMHCFHRIEGHTVDEVIENWKQHNRELQPAIVNDRPIDDIGASSLCSIIVLAGKKELRRVGPMVFPRGPRLAGGRDESALQAWREAALADPDIPRLLSIPERT